MSKATLIIHSNDYEHPDSEHWESVLRILNEEAQRVGFQPAWMASVYPCVADLAGAGMTVNLEVTDPEKPITITVSADGVRFLTKDEPKLVKG